VAGSRSKSRGRGRSRKRRPALDGSAAAQSQDGGEQAVAQSSAAVAREQRGASKRAARRARARAPEQREFRDPLSVGPRPRSPWHPLPLSELLILVGAVAFVIGLRRGISNGGPPLIVGIGAVVLGTIEVVLREHRSGYRSHTVMLAALPVLVFHSAVVLGLSAFTHFPRALNVALLAVDAGLFYFLFRLLRRTFLTARARAVSWR